MVYSPVIQDPQQKASQKSLRKAAQSQFLVVGYSSDTKGDNAVGVQIANHVSAWQMPAVQSVAVYQLTPELVNNLAAVDYVFFVSPCRESNPAGTLQLDPIFAKGNPQRTEQAVVQPVSKGARPCTPITLLSLAQQLYGRSPQAWLLRVPTVSTDGDRGLSSTTKRECDRALRTIEQFFMNYQQPVRAI